MVNFQFSFSGNLMKIRCNFVVSLCSRMCNGDGLIGVTYFPNCHLENIKTLGFSHQFFTSLGRKGEQIGLDLDL